MSWYKLSGQQLTVCINSLYSSSATSRDLLLFIYFGHTTYDMWDLSSPTRDQTLALCSGIEKPYPPGKSLFFFFFLIYYPKEIFMDYAKISI